MRSAPWVEPALEQCDLVLPMPLAPARLRERGFNQALELARRLAPGKTDATLLLRTRDTPPQSGLARAERLRNLRGAFALEPLRADAVRGRRIVLVDDVMTSGASLFAAAAGAARRPARRTSRPSCWRAPTRRTDARRRHRQSPPCSISSWSNPRFRPTPAT